MPITKLNKVYFKLWRFRVTDDLAGDNINLYWGERFLATLHLNYIGIAKKGGGCVAALWFLMGLEERFLIAALQYKGENIFKLVIGRKRKRVCRCEKQLLLAIYEDDNETVRSAIKRIGMNHKRAWYILRKWSDRGLYDYGISLDLGWLTDEGERFAYELNYLSKHPQAEGVSRSFLTLMAIVTVMFLLGLALVAIVQL
jgi:hypothetical protein